jgi:hypothetical protein
VAPAGGTDFSGDLVYGDDGSPVGDDDRLYSLAWYLVAVGTIIDELSLAEIRDVGNRFDRGRLADVQAIMAGHGWDDWAPARV